MPTALVHSLRTFLSLSAQHDTPLFSAARDLLDDMNHVQDTTLQLQVQAAAKVAPKGRQKKPLSNEGENSPDPEDNGYKGVVVSASADLDRCEDDDSAIESSIKRALLSIGMADWNCVRHGQGKAGAGRITVSQRCGVLALVVNGPQALTRVPAGNDPCA